MQTPRHGKSSRRCKVRFNECVRVSHTYAPKAYDRTSIDVLPMDTRDVCEFVVLRDIIRGAPLSMSALEALLQAYTAVFKSIATVPPAVATSNVAFPKQVSSPNTSCTCSSGPTSLGKQCTHYSRQGQASADQEPHWDPIVSHIPPQNNNNSQGSGQSSLGQQGSSVCPIVGCPCAIASKVGHSQIAAVQGIDPNTVLTSHAEVLKFMAYIHTNSLFDCYQLAELEAIFHNFVDGSRQTSQGTSDDAGRSASFVSSSETDLDTINSNGNKQDQLGGKEDGFEPLSPPLTAQSWESGSPVSSSHSTNCPQTSPVGNRMSQPPQVQLPPTPMSSSSVNSCASSLSRSSSMSDVGSDDCSDSSKVEFASPPISSSPIGVTSHGSYFSQSHMQSSSLESVAEETESENLSTNFTLDRNSLKGKEVDIDGNCDQVDGFGGVSNRGKALFLQRIDTSPTNRRESAEIEGDENVNMEESPSSAQYYNDEHTRTNPNGRESDMNPANNNSHMQSHFGQGHHLIDLPQGNLILIHELSTLFKSICEIADSQSQESYSLGSLSNSSHGTLRTPSGRQYQDEICSPEEANEVERIPNEHIIDPLEKIILNNAPVLERTLSLEGTSPERKAGPLINAGDEDNLSPRTMAELTALMSQLREYSHNEGVDHSTNEIPPEFSEFGSQYSLSSVSTSQRDKGLVPPVTISPVTPTGLTMIEEESDSKASNSQRSFNNDDNTDGEAKSSTSSVKEISSNSDDLSPMDASSPPSDVDGGYMSSPQHQEVQKIVSSFRKNPFLDNLYGKNNTALPTPPSSSSTTPFSTESSIETLSNPRTIPKGKASTSTGNSGSNLFPQLSPSSSDGSLKKTESNGMVSGGSIYTPMKPMTIGSKVPGSNKDAPGGSKVESMVSASNHVDRSFKGSYLSLEIKSKDPKTVENLILEPTNSSGGSVMNQRKESDFDILELEHKQSINMKTLKSMNYYKKMKTNSGMAPREGVTTRSKSRPRSNSNHGMVHSRKSTPYSSQSMDTEDINEDESINDWEMFWFSKDSNERDIDELQERSNQEFAKMVLDQPESSHKRNRRDERYHYGNLPPRYQSMKDPIFTQHGHHLNPFLHRSKDLRDELEGNDFDTVTTPLSESNDFVRPVHRRLSRYGTGIPYPSDTSSEGENDESEENSMMENGNIKHFSQLKNLLHPSSSSSSSNSNESTKNPRRDSDVGSPQRVDVTTCVNKKSIELEERHIKHKGRIFRKGTPFTYPPTASTTTDTSLSQEGGHEN